jgi:hypothetical protein
LDGILAPDDALAVHRTKQGIKAVYGRGVTDSNWAHFYDFSVNQFKALVRSENARLVHPLKLLNGKGKTGKLNGHNLDSHRKSGF